MWMPSAWALTSGVGMSARVPSHATSSFDGASTGLAATVEIDAAAVGSAEDRAGVEGAGETSGIRASLSAEPTTSAIPADAVSNSAAAASSTCLLYTSDAADE